MSNDIEPGKISSDVSTLRNREEVFGNAAAVEENKRLRDRVAHMSMEGASLRRKVVQAQDEARAEIERFQHLLERMYRDSIREMKDRIFSDIIEGMNDSAKELMCKQDQLKEEVATLKWHSSSIEGRCKKLESQKSKFKMEADATKLMVEEQTGEIMRLKMQLQQALRESGELRELVSSGQQTNVTGSPIHTDSDSSKQIEDLNNSIDEYKKQLEEAQFQKNQWREKSCSYSQTCARLQAELQMAIDHLTIDPTSYSKKDDAAEGQWHQPERHVTFTEDTKMYSGKMEANPWEHTGRFNRNQMGTGIPHSFQSYDEDPHIQALENALMSTGGGDDDYQKEDPLAAFRPGCDPAAESLAPTVSGVPPIDFFVMVGDCKLDEHPDTPPGTPDFFKMDEAATKPQDQLHEELESAAQNMWLVQDNGLVPDVGASDSEDLEDLDETDLAQTIKCKVETATGSCQEVNQLEKSESVAEDNPWVTGSTHSSSDSDQPVRSFADELFGRELPGQPFGPGKG